MKILQRQKNQIYFFLKIKSKETIYIHNSNYIYNSGGGDCYSNSLSQGL